MSLIINIIKNTMSKLKRIWVSDELKAVALLVLILLSGWGVKPF